MCVCVFVVWRIVLVCFSKHVVSAARVKRALPAFELTVNRDEARMRC